MTELKAYACMETYEYTGAILFAKTNLEARKWAANEYNDGELGGMSVHRAPWADQYASTGKIPVEQMIWHGWHFECFWSGVRMDEGLYNGENDKYNEKTGEWETEDFFLDKKPIGFQYGPVFACQQYADEYAESKRIEKEFHEEQLKYFRAMILARLPDAVLVNGVGYEKGEYISSRDMKTDGWNSLGERRIHEVSLSIEFPGMKHWAALKLHQPSYGKIGPTKPYYTCANGDLEVFQAWVDEQKEKYKL